MTKPEEIQIVLLGAPGTGKTRLQSRYTLRQFVDIESEGAQRMGGHKHLRLLDGTEVHLIIHELRTGRLRNTFDSTNSTLSRREEKFHEANQRKKLLEQSDAVMLVFNPWAKETYEWINGKIIEDILYTGQKKQLSGDIIRLLDGLAAAMPQRTKSTRSALSFSSITKKLPRRPDSPADSESEVSLFSNDGEKQQEEDRIDYRGELKRISIVVEGSALKKAEFMIHEKDLPSPPPPQASPTPSPMVAGTPTTVNGKKLPTIREVDEASRNSKRVAVMVNRRHLPIMKHDSLISIQSASSRSSAYSEIVVGTVTAAAEDSTSTSNEEHPALREAGYVSDEPLEERIQRRATRTPNEETEVPVLVVATATDKLKDNGGALDRLVTAEEGQRLARKFGPNCAYIETSAKVNSNVDEAYGIIVDQVMAKRTAHRRDELARKRLEAAIAAVQEESRPATRLKERARSCMPYLSWMDGIMAQVQPALETVAGAVAKAFATAAKAAKAASPRSGESDSGSAPEVEEDVWGERVEAKPTRHSKRQSRQLLQQGEVSGAHEEEIVGRGPSALNSKRTSALASRTMSHDYAAALDTTAKKAVEVIPEIPEKQLPEVPADSNADEHQFTREDFAMPARMITVTALSPMSPKNPGPGTKKQPTVSTFVLPGTAAVKDTVGGLARRASQLARSNSGRISRHRSTKLKPEQHDGHVDTSAADIKTAAQNIASNINQLPDLIRRKSTRSRKSTATILSETSTRKSVIPDRPPTIPPLEFDAIVIDDKRASVSILVRPGDQERDEEQVATFLAQDMTRDSFVMMLSPTTATRTLSAFVKEINSARAGGISNVAGEGFGARRKSRRASEGLAAVPPLLEGETWDEKTDVLKRATVAGSGTETTVLLPVVVENDCKSESPTIPTLDVPRISMPPPAPKMDRLKQPPAALSRSLTVRDRSPPPLYSPTDPLTPSRTTQDTERVLTPLLPALPQPISKTSKNVIVTTTEITSEGPQSNPRRAKPKQTDGTWVRPPPRPSLPRAKKNENRPVSAWV